MFKQEFHFRSTSTDTTYVCPSTIYSIEQGYGFINELVKQENEILTLPELNNGFDSWYWYHATPITTILNDEDGAYVVAGVEGNIPLCFKSTVPKAGNYFVTVELISTMDVSDFILFTGRRRIMVRKHLKKGESFKETYNINICDIIPRGTQIPYKDTTFDLSLLGEGIRLSTLHIEENNTATLYIAGDSTVTDQPGCYPYSAHHCYSGWGQGLTSFLSKEVAVSNHAHSGLTTETFRSEGHYHIISSHIKEGDYCLFQFAHNDQKLSHLKAREGYRTNLVNYIKEIRDKGAIPILVTPICRNSWKGNDGTYNDLLIEYANLCLELGKEMDVPVLDLHQKTLDFIRKLGLEASKSYFYPGDYTHTNDYGAYLCGYFVATELMEYFDFVQLDTYSNWLPPIKISGPIPPVGLESIVTESKEITSAYKDIDSSPRKEDILFLVKHGILPSTEEAFRPLDIINRVEAISFVSKLYGFFATNVYNDMFTDVVGHEWYAGMVECACANGIFNMSLVKDKLFHPKKEVTYEEFMSYLSNGYASRKGSLELNKVPKDLYPSDALLTREEAAKLAAFFKTL